MPVATVNLLSGEVTTSGPSQGITCPDGYTIIIKHISLRNIHTATQTVSLIMFKPGMVSAHLPATKSLATGEYLNVDCWLVLEVTMGIYVQSSLGPYTYWVSGSLLSGEAPPVLPLVDIALPGQLPALP